MNHLSIDEVIEFVSFNKMTKENLELAARVNAHICRCEKCLELVNKYQAIYDEYTEAALCADSSAREEENVLYM